MPNSRAKGRRGERQVLGLVHPWWMQVEPCEFAVTPQSGGFSTRKVRGEFKIAGDLMTTARRWPFTVEVKWRERWSLARLADGKPSPVWGWWHQVQESAEQERDAKQRGGGEPMLWFKKNRQPWMVMLRFDFVRGIAGMPAPDIAWPSLPLGELGVGVQPVVYLADELLGVHPEKLAAKRGRAA